jgi:hypothetical protein
LQFRFDARFQKMDIKTLHINNVQGRIHDFKLRGDALKKLGRAEVGAKICGVFRVKYHDFTPKNHKFFPILGGRTPGAPPPPLDPPLAVLFD